ncbi:MAG TPA: DIP1984 family protein [Syntrophomonadaceae bacterium]|nr:DIP1984 family protein [Syntrophomonadaceae bacterium]
MKLAEALLERKSLKDQISALKERAINDARVQEGDEPAEKPEDLVAEINKLAGRLEKLVIDINRTNARAKLPDGSSIMEAIARRDMLKLRHQVAKDLAEAAVPERGGWRLTRSEVKFQPTIDIARWRREADALAKAYRELDAAIQAANWTIDLIEE